MGPRLLIRRSSSSKWVGSGEHSRRLSTSDERELVTINTHSFSRIDPGHSRWSIFWHQVASAWVIMIKGFVQSRSDPENSSIAVLSPRLTGVILHAVSEDAKHCSKITSKFTPHQVSLTDSWLTNRSPSPESARHGQTSNTGWRWLWKSPMPGRHPVLIGRQSTAA